MKYWKMSEQDLQKSESFAGTIGVSNMLGGILQSRGFELSEAKSFLSGEGKLHNPYLMKGMEEAVAIIREAIDEDKKVAVFGDYDCDGVTATAILMDYLDNIGCDVLYYIPHREEEGYGISIPAIEELHRMGVGLIITVDNGISGIDEIARAKELGMMVVVTDHHQPREILPPADAILNPHREGCEYPFKELCGAGVAFKLICALEDDLDGYETLLEYCDILAIGTVADIVELKDENRIFVREGINSLREPHRIGLQRLLESMNTDLTSINSDTIGFGIAPRINAVGRLDTAELAVLLLLTDSVREAEEIIEKVQGYNQSRREIEGEIFKEIKNQVKANPQMLSDRVLVFSGENWNAGVIGIVASRVVGAYGKPAIIISISADEAKASGRSVEGFSLIDGIFNTADLLTKYGGHPMAVGFSLQRKSIDTFRERINAFAKENYFKMPTDSINVHYICETRDITVSSAKSLSKLEPFGAGNEKPNLCIVGAQIVKILPLSDGKHQRVVLNKDGEELQVLFFGTTREQLEYVIGDIVDIVFTISVSSYNGVERTTLKGLDIHISSLNQDEYFLGKALYDNLNRGELKGSGYVPTREETAMIYRYIRQLRQMPAHDHTIYIKSTSAKIPYIHYLIAIESMLELGLILKRQTVEGSSYIINPVSAKVCLESSAVIRSLLSDET